MSDANLFDVGLQQDADDPPGYRVSYVRVGPLVGGEKLGLSVYGLPPGQSICPYHWEASDEEWLIVLAGRPTVRTPEGERELAPWDTICFPASAEGAHKVTNRTEEPARVAMLSTKNDPGVSFYPDSNKVGVWPPGKLFRIDDAVEYFEGEL
ncbi:MAG TPA: cupin domain-containing protein [Gaiellaceae bacterium]|nr:cupin domain-containing protein [Gaiellaceae bacterium]